MRLCGGRDWGWGAALAGWAGRIRGRAGDGGGSQGPGIWAGRDAPRAPRWLRSEAPSRAGCRFLPASGKRRSGQGSSTGGFGARLQVRAPLTGSAGSRSARSCSAQKPESSCFSLQLFGPAPQPGARSERRYTRRGAGWALFGPVSLGVGGSLSTTPDESAFGVPTFDPNPCPKPSIFCLSSSTLALFRDMNSPNKP
ncbi:protein LBH isoform X1 [Lynx canadensis]|uniref:protein LBH isoform X1 n=1 Tax=Lynx canadensis TaxID=61383 RepID=UPI0011B03CD2|nr:protein LBH isoform X1 [Lynx canadensis]